MSVDICCTSQVHCGCRNLLHAQKLAAALKLLEENPFGGWEGLRKSVRKASDAVAKAEADAAASVGVETVDTAASAAEGDVSKSKVKAAKVVEKAAGATEGGEYVVGDPYAPKTDDRLWALFDQDGKFFSVYKDREEALQDAFGPRFRRGCSVVPYLREGVVDEAGDLPRSLTGVMSEAHGNAVDKGWWDGQKSLRGGLDRVLVEGTIAEKLALIHSEVSEALEDFRDGKMTTATSAAGKPEGFPTELSDIIIRVLDLAGALDIDIESEVEKKMAFNRTRPRRHGGKRC